MVSAEIIFSATLLLRFLSPFSSNSTMAEVQPLNFFQDPSNSYYIHPNDNPSLVLATSIFEGPNYHRWSQVISMALQMKNKFEFVDGSIRKPLPTDHTFVAWKKCNTLVFSWLYHSMSFEIVTSIISFEKPYDVARSQESISPR